MAVFCDKTGVRIVAPTGDESADFEAFMRAHKGKRPVCVAVDAENGWQPVQPKPEKPVPAPEPERVNKTAAPAANEAPRRGNR